MVSYFDVGVQIFSPDLLIILDRNEKWKAGVKFNGGINAGCKINISSISPILLDKK